MWAYLCYIHEVNDSGVFSGHTISVVLELAYSGAARKHLITWHVPHIRQEEKVQHTEMQGIWRCKWQVVIDVSAGGLEWLPFLTALLLYWENGFEFGKLYIQTFCM